MSIYKAPKAELEVEGPVIFSPVKAIVYGLFFSIVLTGVASIVVAITFALLLGADISDETAFESLVTNNTALLITDVLVSFFVLYFAGRATGKRVPGQEIKYGFIVSALSVAIYLSLSIAPDALSLPMWYNIASLAIIFLAINYGAQSLVNNKQKQ